MLQRSLATRMYAVRYLMPAAFAPAYNPGYFSMCLDIGSHQEIAQSATTEVIGHSGLPIDDTPVAIIDRTERSDTNDGDRVSPYLRAAIFSLLNVDGIRC